VVATFFDDASTDTTCTLLPYMASDFRADWEAGLRSFCVAFSTGTTDDTHRPSGRYGVKANQLLPSVSATTFL
jgi:hypothetical protein